jgi:hypothetical protein
VLFPGSFDDLKVRQEFRSWVQPRASKSSQICARFRSQPALTHTIIDEDVDFEAAATSSTGFSFSDKHNNTETTTTSFHNPALCTIEDGTRTLSAASPAAAESTRPETASTRPATLASTTHKVCVIGRNILLYSVL